VLSSQENKSAIYLVVDLEWTCCNDDSIPNGEHETIEIGAVLVDGSTLLGFSEFDAFVKPVQHPILTNFCTTLTGIRQEDVDSADEFPKVFARFQDWINLYKAALFCSWGGGDKKRFMDDCMFHKMDYPFTNHLDLSRVFTKVTGRRCMHRRAMKILGVEPEGKHHRGISDARNIVKMLPILLGENGGEC